jgi:plastocyanin
VNRTRLGVTVVVMAVMLGWTAAAVGSDDAQVNIKDDCDPATFPVPCSGNGKTTFPDFVAQLQANGFQANRSAKGWKFAPGQMELDAGQSFTVVNKGGELHTFTSVQNFGLGCVAAVNGLLAGTNGQNPLPPVVPECQTPGILASTGVPAGGSVTIPGLSPGVHRFECLIHPWMQTTVVVEDENENQDEDNND